MFLTPSPQSPPVFLSSLSAQLIWVDRLTQPQDCLAVWLLALLPHVDAAGNFACYLTGRGVDVQAEHYFGLCG